MNAVLMMALSLGAMAQVATDIRPEDKAAYDQAQECRVYSEYAELAFGHDPTALARTRKMTAYWVKRSEQIGARSKLTPNTVGMQKLVIKVEAEKLRPVMLACLEATPDKALR
jgi:hypothetical protein